MSKMKPSIQQMIANGLPSAIALFLGALFQNGGVSACEGQLILLSSWPGSAEAELAGALTAWGRACSDAARLFAAF